MSYRIANCVVFGNLVQQVDLIMVIPADNGDTVLCSVISAGVLTESLRTAAAV